ncbi:unnamed protein product [Protopolystoma xenopodis]|uniref:Uncharacterized protein n=1 Tax=Protopolystoma xenopodis TaxID=117903 RepID=A0A3S5CLQ8_9PLAT|nr:unnamed protein product [Protopolystoma xenopodis]
MSCPLLGRAGCCLGADSSSGHGGADCEPIQSAAVPRFRVSRTVRDHVMPHRQHAGMNGPRRMYRSDRKWRFL